MSSRRKLKHPDACRSAEVEAGFAVVLTDFVESAFEGTPDLAGYEDR
jgi:hypothetical protein